MIRNSGFGGSSLSASPKLHLMSTRQRLLTSAKHLFTERGFEHTATAVIAKAAGTSESQLMKHFGSKEGLLEAIFADGWRKLSYVFVALEVLRTPREKLRMMFELMLNAFDNDPEWKELILLEGRRPRKDHATFMLTEGYLQLLQATDEILRPLASEGELRGGISAEGMRSAMIGTLEGMLREQVLARRLGLPQPFDDDEVRRVFALMVEAFLGSDEALQPTKMAPTFS
jgi:AcrR family transcriptional regulator